jgi:hypothetical protein
MRCFVPTMFIIRFMLYASTCRLISVLTLLEWCHKELFTLERKVERNSAVVAMSQTAKDKLSVPWGRLDMLNKYQAALDNQLYKALKALRETQEWRVESLDMDTAPISIDTNSKAA